MVDKWNMPKYAASLTCKVLDIDCSCHRKPMESTGYSRTQTTYQQHERKCYQRMFATVFHKNDNVIAYTSK